ncbi:MAG: hypothetical protein AAGN35_27215 [Bacteroidota bacterium]
MEKNALAGLAIVSLTLSGTVTSLLYKRLRTYLSLPAVFVVMGSLMAAGYAIVSGASSYSTVIAGMVTTGLRGGLFLANLNIWRLQITRPEIRGTVVGMGTMAVFAGQFVSPIAVEALHSVLSLPQTFLAAGGLMALLGVGYLGLAMQSRKVATS